MNTEGSTENVVTSVVTDKYLDTVNRDSLPRALYKKYPDEPSLMLPNFSNVQSIANLVGNENFI